MLEEKEIEVELQAMKQALLIRNYAAKTVSVYVSVQAKTSANTESNAAPVCIKCGKIMNRQKNETLIKETS